MKPSFPDKNKKASKNSPEAEPNTIRLNKFVAHAGICSRRKADEHIKAGEVQVNGEVVREMGHRLKDSDVVKFKGKVIKRQTEMVYIILNKPKNTVTTTSDERGRKTVMDIVKKATPHRIYPVGRLDRETTGVLILTNDGDLAQKLAHPSYEIKKIYHVTLDKMVIKKHLEMIKEGLELEDGNAPVDQVHYVSDDKCQIGIEIHIGRNRIVRRIFEHLGYEVKKLDRVYYGGLTKKDLQRGWFRNLTKQEVIMLKHFL